MKVDGQPFIHASAQTLTDLCAEEHPDVSVQNEGSIFILWPITDAGTAWLEANVASAQRWGADGFVVDHRYVGDVIFGMIESGLEVAHR